jgi:hypothetical protein
MTKYLAGVLSVIAVGVSLIAYGLIVPRATVLDGRSFDVRPRPVAVSGGDDSSREPAASFVDRTIPSAAAGPVATYRSAEPVSMNRNARAVRTVMVEPEPEVVTRTVVRERGRNWKKTAMIVGGSTAAGAGLGGIVGGKKGALIGAAIGGGASTIYETTK